MVFCIIKIYSITGSSNNESFLTINLPDKIQNWLFVGLFFGLTLKIPVVSFHIWKETTGISEAHVEAPIAGFILLSGILLKLGWYGLIRLSYPL